LLLHRLLVVLDGRAGSLAGVDGLLLGDRQRERPQTLDRGHRLARAQHDIDRRVGHGDRADLGAPDRLGDGLPDLGLHHAGPLAAATASTSTLSIVLALVRSVRTLRIPGTVASISATWSLPLRRACGSDPSTTRATSLLDWDETTSTVPTSLSAVIAARSRSPTTAPSEPAASVTEIDAWLGPATVPKNTRDGSPPTVVV
jgi:hypothetical protein